MIYVVATTEVKPEHREAYAAGANKAIAETRKEKGCISMIAIPAWPRRTASSLSTLGNPGRPRRAWAGAASEGLARIVGSDESGADGDRIVTPANVVKR